MVQIYTDFFIHKYQNFLYISQKILGGFFSVFIVQLFTFPFENIRMRLICEQSDYTQQRYFNGSWDTFRKLSKQEGISSFYRGFLANNIHLFFYYGTSQLTYNFLIERTNDNFQDFPIFKFIGFAGISGSVSSTVTYPLDTIKKKLMINGGFGFYQEYKGISDCIQKIWKQESIGGFYRGFLINVFKNIQAQMIYLQIYIDTNQIAF
ncbi:mitochondrial carrier protein, putative [Ichthyophthirius multifiliis]|uniref:Mitochondrial carrier protein, putative n=1 Tax=Ichthyophthirius multifiliis TaxID=5932 RepID=G0QLC7_ICHMU|nr:mitochondrial carrier protein, putative [Ichthyophthirius multifiliis]EGR33973.1 mitochondrial carrier protein, putative [Ichthyophthirius multifiliis]|eukprot:XP_004039277.1 mitochondrial carrier protein, putative [Ichthyophthirius multifiliis]